MKVVKRSDLKHIDDYAKIFEAENHHNHKIIEDDDGVIRWEINDDVDDLVDAAGLNVIIISLYENGYTKNSEIYRKLYRNMGYSLSGYWEVFYWEINNEIASEYRGE